MPWVPTLIKYAAGAYAGNGRIVEINFLSKIWLYPFTSLCFIHR